MNKQITVTLTRVYKKEVMVTIPEELTNGMTDEQISDYLIEEHNFENEEVNFNKAELILIHHNEGGLDAWFDFDRYDITEDGKTVYGGHL